MLDFGRYAAYVWPAYGAAAVVLIGLLAAALRAVVAHERDLARLQAAHPRAARQGDPLAREDGRGDGG